MLFCAVCGAFILNCSLAVRVLFVTECLFITLLTALWGLFLGVKLPNLEWTNEIYPIKQGGAVTFALFGGWGFAALFGGLYFAVNSFMGPAVYLGAAVLITAVLSLALYLWLKTRGAERFASL